MLGPDMGSMCTRTDGAQELSCFLSHLLRYIRLPKYRQRLMAAHRDDLPASFPTPI